MIEMVHLTYSQWIKVKKRVINFTQKYGDKRITHRAIRWLKNLDEEQFQREGTALVLSVQEKRLAGLIAVSLYGIEESIVVVHPDFRNQSIGKNLVARILSMVDKLYGRIALDNIPSLKMAMANGMVGFKIIEAPNGKPSLWLGIGNWKKEDVE